MSCVLLFIYKRMQLFGKGYSYEICFIFSKQIQLFGKEYFYKNMCHILKGYFFRKYSLDILLIIDYSFLIVPFLKGHSYGMYLLIKDYTS